MVNYKVTVFNGSPINAVTTNDIFIKLVGTDGEIEPNKLNAPISFTSTQVAWPVPIGKLILIKFVKKKPEKSAEVDWFPAKVEVESPNGETHIFPIYRWITDSVEQSFREGTALRAFDDSTPEGRDSREQELNQREKDYCWDVYKEGMPHIMEATDVDSLPCEVRFSCTKTIVLKFTAIAAVAELKLKGIADSKDNWTDIKDVNRVFSNKDTKISKYVEENWKEDAFFGYQYLNGVNPILIQRCTALPEHFPVTDEMLFPDGQSSLAVEMELDNIFLLDYNRFDGLKANIVHGKQQYLMAPLVLLQKTLDDKLMPIAIQLKQTPAEDNPIFLPTDSEYDWLMAKMFVRSADSSEHQLNGASTLQGKFVEEVLSFYYKSDDEVQQDSELQKWLSDIFEHGFLSDESTGIPQHLSSVTELVKFVTMVLFTCSAQHSAVNDGQFDYGGWMPNSPFTLQLAPPTTKGTTCEDTMLNTLPTIGTSAQGMATLWLLSKPPFDFVPLGQFPEEHFTEEIPCQLIKDFQEQLEELSASIRVRNIGLDIPYTYMDPALMENSVAI
ncbi:polyunsaturated fatty acid lipoxygenase ALOX8-like [Pseudochaenichthys georgianus]|uniref:polyunsaturated fatty acid lipoxygenase ALOX8-like n=1 Tax=Pseudochaenichthys georgianus TaxID=52239 RepID=UPI00146BD41E|nr:arachidonate 8S-lipoxygenase-like [Pseudochaenichthys georgianus]